MPRLPTVVGILSMAIVLLGTLLMWAEPEPHVVDDLLTPHIAGATR